MTLEGCQTENQEDQFVGWVFQKKREEEAVGYDISATDLSIYQALLKRAGTQSYVWPSYADIVEKTKRSIPTIRQSLKNLEDHDLILAIKIDKENGLGNCYELCPEKIKSLKEYRISKIEKDSTYYTMKATYTELCKPRSLNTKKIIKTKKIISESNFFTFSQAPEEYLNEAKKCYGLCIDSTQYDEIINDLFLEFQPYARKKEYNNTETLLPAWRNWIRNSQIIPRKIKEEKRIETFKPKARRTTKPKIITSSSKESLAPKIGLDAVKEWKETYPEQILACEKVEELKPAMEEVLEKGGIICGAVGCGKTTTAQAVAEQATLKDKIFHMDWDKFYNQYYGASSTQKEQFIEYVVKKKKYLVFDEVGIKPMTPSQKNVFLRCIDERYKLGLPTTVITNYDPAYLKSVDGIGSQSFDRLVGGKKIVTCSWGSLRGKH